MSRNGNKSDDNRPTTEIDDVTAERDNQVNILVENQEKIIGNSDELRNAFSSFYANGNELKNLDSLWEKIDIVLRPEFEDIDELADAVNAVINNIANLDAETVTVLREQDAETDLVDFITEMRLKYGTQLTRQFNRLQKGRNWWSNIKTNAGFRSQRPTFEHELIIDHTEEVIFNSNIDSTLVLVTHFVQQLDSVSEMVGEDILLEMDTEKISNIISILESLQTDIEEYEETIDEITDSQTDPSEDNSDSSSAPEENS